jgi:mannosyl-oligosaccharide alpha-1,2-mannosidase
MAFDFPTDLRAAFGAIANLVFLTPKRQLLYVTDIRNDLITGVFEHLSCFFPGLLALGAHILPTDAFSSPLERNLHKAVARGIAHTCYLTYADMPSGLGADEVAMEPYVEGRFELGRWLHRLEIYQQGDRKTSSIPGVSRLAPPLEPTERKARDYVLRSPVYLLRPEVCQSHIHQSELTLRHLVGSRVYVFDVENYRGGKLEGARVANISGHRKKHPNEDGLRTGSRC